MNESPDRLRPPRPQPWSSYRTKLAHPIFKPFLFSEWIAEWTAFLLSRWSLLEVLSYAGNFSVLVAVIFYFAESKDRTQARHYQAWQVINTAQGKGGSGGRVDAMQELNDDHVPLVGVDVADAFLQNVNLRKADLRRSNFSSADMLGAQLQQTNFGSAKLQFANLRNADLQDADLTDADLSDADLNGSTLTNVKLTGVKLDRADLRNADLANITGWQEATINKADITGVQNPPAGFVEWAMKNGALMTKPESPNQ